MKVIPLFQRFLIHDRARLFRCFPTQHYINRTTTHYLCTKSFSTSSNVNERSSFFTIPNMITVSRVALTPLIVNSILSEDLSTALGLTVIAGVTDVLDGFIARNVPHQKSNIGSLLDPLADKVLVTSLVLSLTAMKFFPISLACIFVLRDVGLIAVVFAAFLRYSFSASPMTFTQQVEIKASNTSKLNTLCQLSSVILSMTYPLYGFPNYEYLQAVWLLSAGTTIISGFGYLQSLPEWRKRIAQISHKKQQP